MRLLGIDFETTGLDTANDRIIEMGAVLWCTERRAPLISYGSFVWADNYPPLSEEVSKLTGIEDKILQEFGTSPFSNIAWLHAICAHHKIDYFVAHNAENFDKPLFYAELARIPFTTTMREIPWIDTRQDIPFVVEPTSRKLNHLSSDHNIMNPFKHRALFDVMTMMLVLAEYDINEVVEYSKIPFITVQAQVSYDDRQLAKDQRYSWEAIGDKRYPKMWVKRIKQNMLEQERLKCKFPIREV